MGLIYMFPKHTDLDVVAIKNIATKKGLKEYYQFDLGEWDLIIYRKALIPERNFYCDVESNCVFANGTWIYKKSDSLEENFGKILADFKDSKIDYNSLIGQYFIIFWQKKNRKITFLFDPLFVQKIFLDKKTKFISTSFLTVVAARKFKSKIDRLSFMEKIATGYIVAPNTLIEDIVQIVPENVRLLKELGIVVLIPPKNTDKIELCNKNFDSCVNYVKEKLKFYFDQFISFAEHYSPELGLSSGFDSRLVLSIYISLSGKPLNLQSHKTEGVHEVEYRYAREIAEIIGSKLKTVVTKPVYRMSEKELSEVLEDGLYYFDGRNSHNMGAFSPVYTKKYKIETLNNDRFSLNGLGGEIFRNYYCTPTNLSLDTFKWFNRHVFYPYNKFVIKDRKSFNEMYKSMIQRISKRLGLEIEDKIDFFTIRRYYSEVRMPDCDGINNNAHNQLVFYLTPFIDIHTITAGYAATPFIGIDGEFEAALIKKFNPVIAGVGSHYGFPFDRIPISYKLCCFLREYLPLEFFLFKRDFSIRYKNLGYKNYQEFIELMSRSKVIKDVVEILHDFDSINFDWSYAFRDKSQLQATAVYVGYFLLRFSDKIEM